jgi:hypothetical protein
VQGQGGVYGPGDLLFSFLGVIILSFGFKILEEWHIMRRHAPEIVGSTLSSATLSMLSTATLCRLVLLPPGESPELEMHKTLLEVCSKFLGNKFQFGFFKLSDIMFCTPLSAPAPRALHGGTKSPSVVSGCLVYLVFGIVSVYI